MHHHDSELSGMLFLNKSRMVKAEGCIWSTRVELLKETFKMAIQTTYAIWVTMFGYKETMSSNDECRKNENVERDQW